MRARTLPIGLAAALLVAACAAPSEPQPRASVSSLATMVTSPMPSSSPTDGRLGPVVLPRLPPQGIAIEDGTGVVFVDLEGRVVARLRDFKLYYEWTVPGPVVLQRNRAEFFVLHVRSHTVRPLSSRDEAFALSPQFESGLGPDADPGLPYPAGTRVEGPDLRGGFWAYALPSPDGSSLLARWSGECEVPNTFFVDRGSAVTVDGQRRMSRAAESIALGWTLDGRAIAMLRGGSCSSGFDRPGVYIFRAPGNGELLFASDGSARMWGAA